MARLRLFAGLREAAGTSEVSVDADTVGGIIAGAVADFGDEFAAGLGAARVWVNGEPADNDTPVSPHDEVALIPPVSGGTSVARTAADPAENMLAFILLLALLVATWIPVEWFVAVAVGAALAWLWDLGTVDARGRRRLNLYALLLAPPIAGMATYAWGTAGWAGAIGAAILISIAWPIFDKRQRDVGNIAATTTVAMVAAAGTGAFVLLRMVSTMTALAFTFIIAAGILGAVATTVYGGQTIDPNVGAFAASVVAGVLIGLFAAEIGLDAGLLGSVLAGAGIIAGRAFGSLIRTGSIVHTNRAPGHLSPIDGLYVAAPLFWIALIILG